MNIFSFFSSSRRSPQWKYAATGHIWRVLFSETGRVIGECRQQEEKLASFFCLHEETGEPLWENVRLSEPWWVGIEAIHRHYLVLHEFLKPDLPEHQRMRVIDIESGAIKWKNDNLTFWFAYGDRLYAYRDLFERRVAYALDLSSGDTVASYEEGLEELQSLRRLAAGEQSGGEYVFPEILDERNVGPDIERLIRKETRGKTIAGNIEMIHERDLLLFNYHAQTPRSQPDAPVLENHFAMYRVAEGDKIFSEVLAEGVRAPTPDSFFLKNQTVYFIKNQQVLTALRLWKL